VHPETWRRVKEMAKRISFTPNTLAQCLLAGQTGTVGLLTDDLEGQFSIPILMGAEDAFGTGKMSSFLSATRAGIRSGRTITCMRCSRAASTG
jgi:LacI family transcriptional regulator